VENEILQEKICGKMNRNFKSKNGAKIGVKNVKKSDKILGEKVSQIVVILT